MEEFKICVYGEKYDEEEEKAGNAKGANKRKTEEEAVSKAAYYDWSKLADDGKLKDLTVQELKSYLTANKLTVAGKKEVLITRILTHWMGLDNLYVTIYDDGDEDICLFRYIRRKVNTQIDHMDTKSSGNYDATTRVTSGNLDDAYNNTMTKVDAAKAKFDKLTQMRSELASEHYKVKESLEKLKGRVENFKCEDMVKVNNAEQLDHEHLLNKQKENEEFA
ncbi:unnamed protein product [Lactuca virosa]|uniref:SAP domain-containing protein n=1 Tax=Lactuca virosa TaxID=75947 RepID=A0AAU9NQ89_9ASTR|nr:unnamed protein product [Lactuca virosa]